LDSIPKKRYLNDFSTAREILRAITGDAVIGVFPEGERIWTGAMKSLKPETLNLFKKFSHIPILPVKLRGNFFAWPRWGGSARRARVNVEFMEPIRIEETWDHKQIEEKISASIDPDDLNHPDFFCRSKRRIEDISKVIYRCPLCRSFDSLILEQDRGECNKCGATIDLDNRYNLTCRNDKGEQAGNLDEIYQKIRVRPEDLEELSSGVFPEKFKALCRDDEQILAFSEEIELSAESFPGMEILFTGPMMLTGKRLVFKNDSYVRSIPLEALNSVTIESNYKLQIYDRSEGKLYQLVFEKGSVLKWQDLIASVIEKEFMYSPNLR
jgi:1-acyl-sn-glycerol-3-phosphate acyltransferase